MMPIEFDSYAIMPIQAKDAWRICNFANANEDRLRRFFPKTLEQNLTPTLSEFFINKKVKQYHLKEEFLFTIKEPTSKELIGLVYIKTLDWDKKQGEFAYCIGYPFEGKGIITQAITKLSEYAFNSLGLETLQIFVHSSNLGSIKVAKNCNFSWTKTLEKEFQPPNEPALNMELYELHKDIKS